MKKRGRFVYREDAPRPLNYWDVYERLETARMFSTITNEALSIIHDLKLTLEEIQDRGFETAPMRKAKFKAAKNGRVLGSEAE